MESGKRGGICERCVEGRYQREEGQTECTACEKGHIVISLGALLKKIVRSARLEDIRPQQVRARGNNAFLVLQDDGREDKMGMHNKNASSVPRVLSSRQRRYNV